jgi:hypothetical protein
MPVFGIDSRAAAAANRSGVRIMTGHPARPAPRLHLLAASLASVFALAQTSAADSATLAGDSLPSVMNASALRAHGGLIGTLASRRSAGTNATPATSTMVSSSVTSCADDGGSDTLRFAVLTADPGDTISLSGLNCSKITLQSPITILLDDLTIEGPGPDKLTIDGSATDRVFLHTGKGTFGLTDITIANGKTTGDQAFGGCIYSKGNVALTHAVITSCQAIGQSQAIGGGLTVYGTLTAEASTISNNLAETTVGTTNALVTAGGGAFAHSLSLQHTIVTGNTAHALLGSSSGGGVIGYSVTTKYSTISGNEAIAVGDADNYSVAGGIAAVGSLVMVGSTLDHNEADVVGGAFTSGTAGFTTILQSTISSNNGRLSGGGLAAAGPLSLGSSTIAFNTGGVFGGGGVNAVGPTAVLQSTIIADNTPSDFDGSATMSGANNIIKIVGPSATMLPPMTLSLDPKLGPLAYNGGTTRTHAPSAGSPAINSGDNAGNVPFDQRGSTYKRVVGFAVDIGAVEVDDDHIFGNVFDG